MEVLAICHVHSIWSYDGSWSLSSLRDRFNRRGYRILLMTEHDRGFTSMRLDEYRKACSEVSTSNMLLVPGIEYSDPTNRVHILVWGPVPFLGENLPTNEVLDGVKASNGVAVFAHPSRRDAWRCFERSWADRLLGIEVWNRKYDGWAPSRTAPNLQNMVGAIPFVGLDFHTQRQAFPLAMALDIHGNIDETTVIDSLRSRRCHARAFRQPLNRSVVRRASPMLNVAERSRRIGASIVKYARRLSK